ncbi:RNA-binding protein (U1 snRNP-like), putative [Hepatocystis sp. ex Piliocolobus tephrosceles]|nr:RNA-binding protein (U1 snRNP-like), putative [Hepatocystis sp. ex Piliocolobus tephrosceles]
MPKYYCEYCDIYLTHSSPVGRRQHIQGRKHISAKIEYFQNLLREKGITPQNFLDFLGDQPYNNTMNNPMINNYMQGNYNPYMKFNSVKSYRPPVRGTNTYRGGMFVNNKYSRAGYTPPSYSHNKYQLNQNSNNIVPPNTSANNKYINNYNNSSNQLKINNKNNTYVNKDTSNNITNSNSSNTTNKSRLDNENTTSGQIPHNKGYDE